MIIIDSETEKGKEYPIQPKHIDTQSRFWEGFIDYNTFLSARRIVKLCQENGGWFPFTKKQIDEYSQSNFNFNRLCDSVDHGDERNFVVRGEDGRYRLTHEFILFCFRAAPVI